MSTYAFEGKDAKAFVKALNDFNQIFKNAIPDKHSPFHTEYIMTGNRIFIHDNKLTIFDLCFTGKTAKFYDAFNSIHATIHGHSLYTFIKDYRSNIDRVVINETDIFIDTNITNFSYHIINKKRHEFLEYAVDIDNVIRNKQCHKIYVCDSLSEDELKQLNDNLEPLTISRKVDDIEFNIRLTKRMLLGLKVGEKFTSKVHVSIMETTDNDVYMARLVLDNDGDSVPFTSFIAFRFVNFV